MQGTWFCFSVQSCQDVLRCVLTPGWSSAAGAREGLLTWKLVRLWAVSRELVDQLELAGGPCTELAASLVLGARPLEWSPELGWVC